MSKSAATESPPIGGNLYRRFADRLAALPASHSYHGLTPLDFIEKLRGELVEGDDFRDRNTPYARIAAELSTLATEALPSGEPVRVSHETVRRWLREAHPDAPDQPPARPRLVATCDQCEPSTSKSFYNGKRRDEWAQQHHDETGHEVDLV